MRWNLIKEAWSLARKKFPDVKRLFVDLPEKFKCEGQCAIYDLDEPDEPVGILKYHSKMADNHPIIIVSVGEMEIETGVPRFASVDMAVESAQRPLVKKASINGPDIMAQYPDQAVLGEQIAYLVVGHVDGPLYKASDRRISTDSLVRWGRAFGFSEEAIIASHEKLADLGVEVTATQAFNLRIAKRPRKKEFENFQKVRVIDPRSMQLNEGGQVVEHKRNEEDEDFYLVIVDGSEEPSWYKEDQIEKNEVAPQDVPNE
jgi:hypothetical protein